MCSLCLRAVTVRAKEPVRRTQSAERTRFNEGIGGRGRQDRQGKHRLGRQGWKAETAKWYINTKTPGITTKK